MEKEKVERINALARKSRTAGLTEEEKEEQHQLRTQYLREFRENMEHTLRCVQVEQPDGTRQPLRKKQ